MKPVIILSIPVHPVTMPQMLAWLARAIAERTPRQVCTANPEFVITAQQDPAFRRVLQNAALVLPDGVGLLWAARHTGQHLPERVSGSDLIYHLAEASARHGWRLFFLGAAPGVAEQAAHRLAELYPGVNVVGTFAGSPREADAPEICARIRAAAPDVLLVAYGAPAQDLWIDRYARALGVPVSMGVGGTFDFVAQVARRAPRWVQRLGLEWLHRLIHQPWRAKRIWNAVVVFPWRVITQSRVNG